MIRLPPRSTLFPYTTLFRSLIFVGLVVPFIARAFAGPDIRKTLWLCVPVGPAVVLAADRKSTRLNSSHVRISYAVFCLKKKKKHSETPRRVICLTLIWRELG